MHRAQILRLLDGYLPEDEDEKKYKSQIIEFIKNHKDCFDNHNKSGHITASAWLIDKSGQNALLTFHRKLKDWYQLGGHCDSEPDVLASAIREACEESGIQGIVPVNEKIFDIDAHLIPDSPKMCKHYHYDIRFLLQVISDEQITITEESDDLRWFGKNPSELPSQNKSILRMHNKWLCYK